MFREDQNFIKQPTIGDVGFGVLLFFASHMIIRSMFYVGGQHSTNELVLFLLLVAGVITFSHIIASPLLNLRKAFESTLGLPATSALAALGSFMALLSVLPVVPPIFFYGSALLLGFSCGWATVVWASTVHIHKLDKSSFYVSPSLIAAVITYMFFRVIGSISYSVSQGFLLTLPLIAIFCIIRGYQNSPSTKSDDISQSLSALQVLVVISAASAMGCSIVVYLSGQEDAIMFSGLNYMVLFEVISISVILCCCAILWNFAQRKANLSFKVTSFIVFALMFFPTFTMGLIMGETGVPSNSSYALWEVNIWVVFVAIFAYDIRLSPYAVKGLAIGPMFEALCMGQLFSRIATLNQSHLVIIITGVLAVLYVFSFGRQFFYNGSIENARRKKEGTGKEEGLRGSPAGVQQEKISYKLTPVSADDSDALSARCAYLSEEYGLTQREEEILNQLALGRSAVYIAEDFSISYNTTRTHVKHVYEKMNIHSKQELLDLVLN